MTFIPRTIKHGFVMTVKLTKKQERTLRSISLFTSGSGYLAAFDSYDVGLSFHIIKKFLSLELIEVAGGSVRNSTFWRLTLNGRNLCYDFRYDSNDEVVG